MRYSLIAIAIWSSLAAVAGDALDHVAWPTLLAISMGAGGVTLLVVDRVRGRSLAASIGGPPRAWALGLWGIFGYHAFLFAAFAVSPGARVPVNLINYLWPLCLVLFAGMLERQWRARALVGALVGLGGAALAIGAAGLGSLSWTDGGGYLLALGAALTWGGFSALLPRTKGAGGRMAGWCLAAAGIAAGIALVTGWGPALDAKAWGAAIYVGVGPLGLAFTAWEAGLRRASGQVVGALAYLAPPTSTILLAFTVGEPLTWQVWTALALVTGGAALGASERQSGGGRDDDTPE